MSAPFTRSGRQRWGGGLSLGVAGKGFLVGGYFVVVVFGVCAGWGVGCVFVVLVFACCVGCVLVACVRVCWWLCVRVFDGVGHVVCWWLWVDLAVFVWRTVLGISNTAPTAG